MWVARNTEGKFSTNNCFKEHFSIPRSMSMNAYGEVIFRSFAQ